MRTMIETIQQSFAKAFGWVGVVLIALGSITGAAWIVNDLLGLDGLLAYTLVLLGAGMAIFALAHVLGEWTDRRGGGP